MHDGHRQPSIWKAIRDQLYLGGEDFVARLQALLPAPERFEEIPKVQRRPVPPSLQAFAEAYGDKWMAMAAAYGSGAYTLKAIAAYFSVPPSTVSRAVRRAVGLQPDEQKCRIANSDPILHTTSHATVE